MVAEMQAIWRNTWREVKSLLYYTHYFIMYVSVDCFSKSLLVTEHWNIMNWWNYQSVWCPGKDKNCQWFGCITIHLLKLQKGVLDGRSEYRVAYRNQIQKNDRRREYTSAPLGNKIKMWKITFWVHMDRKNDTYIWKYPRQNICPYSL